MIYEYSYDAYGYPILNDDDDVPMFHVGSPPKDEPKGLSFSKFLMVEEHLYDMEWQECCNKESVDYSVWESNKDGSNHHTPTKPIPVANPNLARARWTDLQIKRRSAPISDILGYYGEIPLCEDGINELVPILTKKVLMKLIGIKKTKKIKQSSIVKKVEPINKNDDGDDVFFDALGRARSL